MTHNTKEPNNGQFNEALALLYSIANHQAIHPEINEGATIRDIILIAAGKKGETAVNKINAKKCLSRFGIGINKGDVLISNDAQYCKTILSGTKLSDKHYKILKRLKCAKNAGAFRFSSIHISRAVSLPVAIFDEEFEDLATLLDDRPCVAEHVKCVSITNTGNKQKIMFKSEAATSNVNAICVTIVADTQPFQVNEIHEIVITKKQFI